MSHPSTLWFTSCLANPTLVHTLKQTKLIITAVDGCLTNGTIYISQNGDEAKGFCIQDGFGITRALKNNLSVAFLSGRNDPIASHRAHKLGIPDDLCLVGFDGGKKDGVLDLMNKTGASKEQTVFFGDDLLDIEIKEMVSLFASPTNALFYVGGNADLMVPYPGGQGALRALLDLILYVQQKHQGQAYIDTVVKPSV